MDLPVMLLAKRVLLVLLQILEQALGQHRVVIAPPEVIRCRRTLPRVRLVLLVPLQIPAQVLAQPRVLIAPLACIRYHRTLLRVRRVPPLPTPPLSNAPLVPIKQLQPVMLDIMETLVMLLVNRVLPVPLQIMEQVLAQPRVLLVLLVRIPCLRTLPRVLVAPRGSIKTN